MVKPLCPPVWNGYISSVFGENNKVNHVLQDMLKLASREKKDFIREKTELLNTKLEEYVLKPYMFSQNKKIKVRL